MGGLPFATSLGGPGFTATERDGENDCSVNFEFSGKATLLSQTDALRRPDVLLAFEILLLISASLLAMREMVLSK